MEATMHDTTIVYDRMSGIDEFNLAEFPIFDVSSKSSQSKTKISYSAKYRSEPDKSLMLKCASGIPTVSDGDVLYALLLIGAQNSHAFAKSGRIQLGSRRIDFSKSQILQVLAWSDSGASYRRLCESLDRWASTRFIFENWKDHKTGTYVTADCNIVSSHTVLPSKSRRGQGTLPFCYVNFTEEFWQLMQSENLFSFNYYTYRSLASGTAKQAYRLLSKRLYLQDKYSFDLRNFACGHLGFSENNSPSRLRQRLKLVLEELVRINLIDELSDEDRYTKKGHGQYDINFTKVKQQKHLPAPDDPELIARMIQHNLARTVASKFYNDPEISNDQIDVQIQHLEHVQRKDAEKVKDPAAWLYRAIAKNHPLPADFESRKELEIRLRKESEARRKRDERLRAKEAAKRAKEAEEAALARSEEKRKEMLWSKAESFLGTLPKEDRDELIETALRTQGGDFGYKYANKYRTDPQQHKDYQGFFREYLIAHLTLLKAI